MRRATVGVPLVLGVLVLAACSSGPPTVGRFLQGTWLCTTGDVPTTVVVGDGTFTIEEKPAARSGGGLLYLSQEKVRGTWSLSFEDLTIRTTDGDFRGMTSFESTGLPAKDDAKDDALVINAPWTATYGASRNGSIEGSSVSMRTDGNTIRIVQTGESYDTTTTCSKRG